MKLTQESFEWSTEANQAGNLKARLFGDATNIYFKRLLEYDDLGNIKKDSLFGNLTGNAPDPLIFKNGFFSPKPSALTKPTSQMQAIFCLKKMMATKVLAMLIIQTITFENRFTKRKTKF